MYCPCRDCDNKGCGSFHDKCYPYQLWIQQNAEKKQEQKEKDSLDRFWKGVGK